MAGFLSPQILLGAGVGVGTKGKLTARDGGDRRVVTRGETIADRCGATQWIPTVVRGRFGGPWAWSGRECQGTQLGQGTMELGFPVLAPGEMQSDSARRAGEASGQGEESSPQGIGGHQLLAQSDAGCPAGQVVGHDLDGQPGGVGGEAA